MTLVPSWPPQHAIQQISESDWGRPLIAVDSTAILQVRYFKKKIVHLLFASPKVKDVLQFEEILN